MLSRKSYSNNLSMLVWHQGFQTWHDTCQFWIWKQCEWDFRSLPANKNGFCSVFMVFWSFRTVLWLDLLKDFSKKIPFGVNTAEWGRVNNDWKILKGKTFYNDWTTSDTQTVFGQQSQALEIKDILQLSERKHHADSQAQNHTTTNRAGPRSIISNEMKSYFIGFPILHAAQFSERLLLKMHQESLEGSAALFVWPRTLYEK